VESVDKQQRYELITAAFLHFVQRTYRADHLRDVDVMRRWSYDRRQRFQRMSPERSALADLALLK
jgi:hypothetical protein